VKERGGGRALPFPFRLRQQARAFGAIAPPAIRKMKHCFQFPPKNPPNSIYYPLLL
jgi:hypothetical protein